MVSAVVFDLDGVVYRGASGIPGVAAEIYRLQKKVKVLFLTNNATRSRLDYVRHLAGFGINARISDVMTAAFGCAHHVRDKYGRGKSVFVIGEQGFRDELEMEADARIVEGSGARIVAVGLDRHLTYARLDTALASLNSGAAFVVANTDPVWPHEKGVSIGTGAIAAALIYASGRKPDAIIGKPSTYLMDKLLEMHKIRPSQAAFVGDRLDVDVRMANKAGMKSMLVLTGIAKKEDVGKAPPSDKPDFVVQSAAHAGRALGI